MRARLTWILSLAGTLAGCGKAPCTVKHLDLSFPASDRSQLTAAQIAGWDCALSGSHAVAGVAYAEYACTRCD